MADFDVVIYGSYGFTGRLIVDLLTRKNLRVLLSGRDSNKLSAQAAATSLPYVVVSCDDHAGLVKLLQQTKIVLHCGGPFIHTASAMVAACLETGTHYVDITGEYQVFDQLARNHQAYADRGILVMPGVGFDVVPSDCLALYLKECLPSATHLRLAFASGGGLSRGTTLTMIESLGSDSTIRKDGDYVSVPLGSLTLDVNFAGSRRLCVNIPWGDIATAFYSTGIPNIAVYTAMEKSQYRMVRFGRYMKWFLKMNIVRNALKNQVMKKPDGPSRQRMQKSGTVLWGEVRDAQGRSVSAELTTLNGYLLTAEASVHIVSKLLQEKIKPGYFTPAMYFGSDLILELPGSSRKLISEKL